MPDESNLKPGDIKATAKAIYRERRKSYGNLPVSRKDVHKILGERELKTSKGESFVSVNNEDEEIIIFSCVINLITLCGVRELFMDGTFQYCQSCCHRHITTSSSFIERSKGRTLKK